MVFGRIYDKERESKLDHYKGAVRYEVEYKDLYAKRLAQRLAAVNQSQEVMLLHLHSFFADRGNDLGLSDDHCLSLGALVNGSDHSRELRWLAVQIRPTVQRLVECGLAHEVFEALGFGEKPKLEMDQMVHAQSYTM
jgi:hypothetical protein